MPVDIATGAVRLECEDVVIEGKLDLIWDRLYNTRYLTQAAAPMGRGWQSRYFASLTIGADGYTFVTPEGDTEDFPDPDALVANGGVLQRPGTFEEIFTLGRRYIVQRWDVETGEVWRYCFMPEPGRPRCRLQAIEDVTGRGLDLVWDAQERLVGVRQRLERRLLALDYSDAGFITQLTLVAASGNRHVLARYVYDADGMLAAAHDAADLVDRYEYGADGRIAREIAKDGGVFTYRYDAKGRCVKTGGLDRFAERRLRFFEAINFTEVVDSHDNVTRYHYLASGQMALEIDPLGNRKSTAYDAFGRIVSTTDATGAATVYSYDAAGNRASVTDALGNTTSLLYTAQHLPVAMRNAEGRVWRREFDDANQLVASIDALGHRWTLEYDAQGNIAGLQNPLGAWKRQRYVDGVLVGVTDWLGQVTRFAHDDFGRVVEFVGPVDDVARLRYDVLGNPVEVALPDGAVQRATYDGAGNMMSLTDGNGATTYFLFGPCRRLLERIDPLGGTTRYGWGSEVGWLDSVTNENGEIYRFERDALGHVVRSQGFDGAVRQFRHDAAGRVLAYTNANGESIDIRRDAIGRVAGLALPDGETASFEFSGAGYLVAAANADIAIRFERDAIGRVVREVQGEDWIDNTLDPLGNLVRTATSRGHTVDCDFDANGFVSRVSALEGEGFAIERNGYSQETTRRAPGGLTLRQRYDRLGRLLEQSIGIVPTAPVGTAPSRPGAIVRRAFSHDRGGNLLSVLDGRWGRNDFEYDPAQRLIQALREKGLNELFDYDPAGNITRARRSDDDGSSESAWRYAAGNRLVTRGDTLYEYDAEGRLVRKIEAFQSPSPAEWSYEWDAIDRLRSVMRPDGAVWRYRYDPLGRRVEKAGPGARRRFLWQEDVAIQEIDDDKPVAAWIYDRYSHAPLATVQNDRLLWMVNDAIGTPREVVDRDGAIVWSAAYTAWGEALAPPPGEALPSAGRLVQNIRFPGHYFDAETGLHYNRHRYYEPASGRYLCDDPIGLRGGLSGYLYCTNPIGFIDPWGLTGDPAKATHITYEGVKDGKPYIGYASKPGLGHSAEDVLKYRYPDTDHFDVPPKPFYVGDGLEGKQTARGLEQRVFEDRGGCVPCPPGKTNKTSNKQNPVGENNANRDDYLAAADKHRAKEAAEKEEKPPKKGKKAC
ncbi:DUF6531 domain-containing protein [Variovorax sp. LjRoot290]|uniref:RHS repeat-associated core domain-containing protein n=1 Tax=Variovorax sp. LjRoot290 TaxID=3342316 RepID=UPI003ED0092F